MREHERFDRAREGLTELVIGAAIEVHRHLGPGLLESVYEECLAWEIAERGASVRRQVPLALEYKGLRLDGVYRLDLLVEGSVLVEVKTVDRVIPVHEAQLLTYLKLARVPVGLLLNFRTAQMRDGIRRMEL
jgi:GxxExxY protein